MISSARPAATAAGGNPGKPGANSTDSTAAPFDSVLAQETEAASGTGEALDMLAQSGACAEGCLDELLEDSSIDADEVDPEDTEDAADAGPLAFLASLLALPGVAPQAPGQGDSADGGGGQDEAGVPDALAGSAKPQPQEPLNLATATNSLQALSGQAITPETAQVLASKNASDPGSSGTDANRGADSAAGLARAAEWLAHAPRQISGAEKHGIATSVRDPRWAEEFGTRIALMVRGGESSASLQLSPVDLGPLEVSISVRDAQATIHFGAAQAETRALLEASIPRLREMLAAQGFQLMDASVSQGFTRQSRPDAPHAMRGETESEPEVRAVTSLEVTRLLDTYA